MADFDINKAKKSIAGIESGGNYTILGPKQGNGDYAIGKYQVMSSNVPSWTKEALGTEMTPEQFRNDPAAQEKVFENKFGGYAQQYGPAGGAAMWFSGSPNTGSSSSDSLGTSVPNYVSKFMKGYDGSSSEPEQQQQAAVYVPQVMPGTQTNQPTQAPPTPPAKEDPNKWLGLLQAALAPAHQQQPLGASPIIQANNNIVNNQQRQQQQQPGLLDLLYRRNS